MAVAQQYTTLTHAPLSVAADVVSYSLAAVHRTLLLLLM